jgi:hypothetical protein
MSITGKGKFSAAALFSVARCKNFLGNFWGKSDGWTFSDV